MVTYFYASPSATNTNTKKNVILVIYRAYQKKAPEEEDIPGAFKAIPSNSE